MVLRTALLQLQRRPLLLNGLSGCLLFLSSDALAQRLERKGLVDTRSSGPGGTDTDTWLDGRRFAVAGLMGMFISGAVYPRAYHLLDQRWPARSFSHVLTKSVVEITTVGLFVNACSIFARGMLVGRTSHEVVPHLLEEIPDVTCNDVALCLPYNLLAFSIIPASIRPTTTALVEAVWQTYISLRSNDYATQLGLPTEATQEQKKHKTYRYPQEPEHSYDPCIVMR